MTLRVPALGVLLALVAPARANEPVTPLVPAPSPAAIVLVAGKPVEIACETKAVVVAEGAPNASKGNVSLRLELAATSNPSPPATAQGRWTVASVDQGHSGAFASAQREQCAAGCPLTLAPNGDIQLWAPAAKSLDALKEGETMLLAVLRSDQALRASTFKGQAIEALEEGHCKKVEP